MRFILLLISGLSIVFPAFLVVAPLALNALLGFETGLIYPIVGMVVLSFIGLVTETLFRCPYGESGASLALVVWGLVTGVLTAMFATNTEETWHFDDFSTALVFGAIIAINGVLIGLKARKHEWGYSRT